MFHARLYSDGSLQDDSQLNLTDVAARRGYRTFYKLLQVTRYNFPFFLLTDNKSCL